MTANTFFITQFSQGKTYVHSQLEDLASAMDTDFRYPIDSLIVKSPQVLQNDSVMFEFSLVSLDKRANHHAHYYRLDGIRKLKGPFPGAEIVMLCHLPNQVASQGDIGTLTRYASNDEWIVTFSESGVAVPVNSEDFLVLTSPAKFHLSSDAAPALARATATVNAQFKKIMSEIIKQQTASHKITVSLWLPNILYIEVLDNNLRYPESIRLLLSFNVDDGTLNHGQYKNSVARAPYKRFMGTLIRTHNHALLHPEPLDATA